MGAFQKLLRGDVLTLRYAVEAEYGITLHTSHNLWPWLVRYCSFIRCRYAVKSNQRTAYQDAFDCQYTSPLIPFAETVLFKTPMSKARRAHGRNVITKGETAWAKGIYLGRSVTSNEYLLGTPDGTVSARSVRRFADSAKAHDRDLLEAMIGVPWDQGTTIGRPKRKIEAIMPMTPSAVPTEAETDEKKAKTKTFEDEPTEPTLNQGGNLPLWSPLRRRWRPNRSLTSPPWRSRSLQGVPGLVEMMKAQRREHAWAEYMLEHCTRRPRM